MKMSKNDLIASYNHKAFERDSLIVPDWKLRERETFLSYLTKENHSRLLEIGAGTGHDSLYFQNQGLATISTDLSPEMVQLCIEKGLTAKVMDFAQLDFPDEYVDSIWSLNCLLHVPKSEIKAVLEELKRVLKPSGLFYLGVYGGEDYEGIWEEDSYTPKRFFSFFADETIKPLLSQFFQIEYFHIVPKEEIGGNFHFQSIILRKG